MKHLITISLCLAVPNLAFLLFSTWSDTTRPWLNLDYALAIIVIASGWRKTGIVLALFFLIIDTISLVTQILPFPRFSDILYLLQFTALSSTLHFYIVIFTCLLIMVKLIAILKIGTRTPILLAIISFNILAFTQVILTQTYEEKTNSKHYKLANNNPISSQSLNLYRMRSQLFLTMFPETHNFLSPTKAGATDPWFSDLDKNQQSDRLFLILSESWGVPANPEVQKSIIKPILDLSNYKVEYGFFQRSGFTLDGELRELCMSSPSHFNLVKTYDGFESCLPNQLIKRGFKTAAMHGAAGVMYGRVHWYPRAGFQSATFFESRIWPRRCHSFPGACDRDMFSLVKSYFSEPGKRFLYWLTLNSHASYDERDIYEHLIDCEYFKIGPTTESCRNIQLHAQYFKSLAHLLTSQEMHNTQTIIVGDHPPVIINKEEKQKNFKNQMIPWLRITHIPNQDAIN